MPTDLKMISCITSLNKNEQVKLLLPMVPPQKGIPFSIMPVSNPIYFLMYVMLLLRNRGNLCQAAIFLFCLQQRFVNRFVGR